MAVLFHNFGGPPTDEGKLPDSQLDAWGYDKSKRFNPNSLKFDLSPGMMTDTDGNIVKDPNYTPGASATGTTDSMAALNKVAIPSQDNSAAAPANITGGAGAGTSAAQSGGGVTENTQGQLRSLGQRNPPMSTSVLAQLGKRVY